MAKYRDNLPQLGGRLFLSDGGIETTLIFHEGLELPDFAAFDLLKTADGEGALRNYFRTYAEIAKRFGTGLILESATWRASSDWGKRLGYTSGELAEANRKAIQLLEQIRDDTKRNRLRS
jgi:S-methylmethionine-dependent homocysteine/selenocysteine methylase